MLPGRCVAKNTLHRKSQLSNLLRNTFSTFREINEYAYFGEISSSTAPHVTTLINTNLTGLSNRLINEAAVFKIIASQYSNQHKELGNISSKNPLTKSDTIKVIQLSEYISQNLDGNLSLKELSKICGLNQKKIQKGFQFFFDETVNKFVINLRVLRAKELLESTDDSVSEIVYQLGLNSRSYFSKIFNLFYYILLIV